ncbi:tigger transposable element-derived protein 1-like isoform X1 [Myotis daubentonii]|uniref:tigger transposable element-derived protein 1-like isoform X1 n=2 Tax=Myotis daubentonii TaxID=98922 RepID=UPI002873C681|nr:tigger transposable element-derived protein 1-like isoform X1 [Myotis daubentonii]XP_059558185.1 tigger transposable element-derived protein 1-like isoform X1 [Myotis daubentonii]XP_059558186.1 tigger transposable element-derived protein 1-like isoform X1 [Myotis daubentonii]XP_059558187.1 tigger transposable element-derived protein 1-like isoform X1 [Myotis daubentonii]XP_059558189.1 tigger transposable element-derived protein 1-like isoform X1 [Myotis daubentonii]
MGPKKVSDTKVKRKVVRTTIELKKEIIANYDKGVRVSDLATKYGMAKSTISTILKHKEAIKKADVAKGVTVLTKQRSQAIEEVEKLLLIWVNEKQLAGDSISEAMICEKAKMLHTDLLRDSPEMSAQNGSFKASRGWFDKFKKRSGIHVVRHGESDSTNKVAADNFVTEFQEFIEAEGFVPQQVFNCDETGLFWKKMPKRTYITQEEKSLPGHKPVKDRLTLLLCGNASGDFKLKPLLVYHSENVRVLGKNNVMKNKWNVMWRANRKAWVTRQFFIEWIHEVFAPSVKKYLWEKQLPLRALLVMDKAPAHPPGLEAELMEEHSFITVRFLPPNITPLIQPMDQQVISNFKKLYTKALFQRCFEVTSETNLTLREFWKEHFNILTCLRLIDEAWGGVCSRTLQSAWKKLWPESVADRACEGCEDKPVSVVEDIVSLGKCMGLEVDDDDVEELVEDHNTELTTEELQDLQREQQQPAAEEPSSEGGREDIPTSLIKGMLGKWGEMQSFIEKYHPDKEVAHRAINLFNDNAVFHFRQMLKRRQKQSLGRFLVRQRPSEPEASSSGAKRRKRKNPRRIAP